MSITIDRRNEAPTLFVGETLQLSIVYKENGVAQDISTGTVYARISDQNGTVLVEDVAQSSSSPASWGTGVIYVTIPASSTTDLYAGEGFLVVTIIEGSVKRVLKQRLSIQAAI